MVVTCDTCHTKFKLDDSKITEKGIKVRCSKCQAVFVVKKRAEEYTMAPDDIKKAIDEALGMGTKPAKGSREEADIADVGFSQSLSAEAKEQKTEEWGEITFSEKSEGKAGHPEHPGRAPEAGRVEAKSGEAGGEVGQELDFGNVDVGEETGEKIDFGGEEEEFKDETKPGGFTQGSEETAPSGPGTVSVAMPLERKAARPLPQMPGQEVSLSKILTMFLLLGVLGGGGILYLKGGVRLSGIMRIFTPEETKKPGQVVTAGMKGSYFQNVRGQQLFIIEGKAANEFDAPRSFIKLRGILFDNTGAEIASREVYGGWSFAEDELRNLSSKEIDDRLGNKMGESLSNFNIPSHGSVPFMVVFYDVPMTIASFSVVVVESQGSIQ